MLQNMFQKGFAKVWLVLVAVVVLGAGVLVWQFWPAQEVGEGSNEPLVNEEADITIPPNDESTPVDETADWQTYRSEEYGYTIKYPAGWEAKDKDASYWCQENPERDCQLYIQFFPPSTQNYSWVSLVIYGNAWRGEGEEKQTNGCQKISNFFLYKDSLFDLTTCFGLGQESTEEIYSQMLSTFKFID